MLGRRRRTRGHRLIELAAALLIAALGCGDSRPAGPDAGDPGGVDAGTACPRPPADADRERRVIVSHPFTDDGPGTGYEVLLLGESGDLSVTGERFEMGRATGGRIAFTPDGRVGVVAQNDGSLGVFTIDKGGAVQVVDPAFTGEFYASAVTIDPAGDRVLVLDGNWRENGGGVYALAIDCDGSLREEGRLLEAKLPAELLFLADGRALLAAADALDSPPDASDAHLLEWNTEPALLSSAAAFPDREAILSAAAVSADGRHLLLGDNAGFSGVPNRVAALAIDGDSLLPLQVLSPIEDPYAVAISPHGNAAVVVSGFGDAIFRLDYDPASDEPFAIAGELDYEGAPPQLPGDAVAIERGALSGLVLVAENLGVRRLRFEPGGAVIDLGLTSTGEETTDIVGAIGVEP